MPVTTPSVIGTKITGAIHIADSDNDAWGTEKVLGVNDGHSFISDALDSSREFFEDASLGRATSTGGDIGNAEVGGDVIESLRHVSSEVMISGVMGNVLSVDFQGAISDSGTADGGSTTTLIDSTQSWTPDEWIGYYVVTGETGTGNRQIRQITDNDATSLTVATWTAPAATFPTYEISVFAPQTKSIATAGGADTITDSTQTWGVNALAGQHVWLTGGTGVGQWRYILSNTGTEITVKENWTTVPDATTTYQVSNQAAQKVYSWADDTLGTFFTYGKNEAGVYTEIYPSLKLTSFEFSGDFGSVLEMTTNGIGSSRLHTSVLNTTTTFLNVTQLAVINRILFNSNSVVRLNTQAGAALASGDRIYPTNIRVNVTRNMEGVFGVGGNTVDEPTSNALPSLELEFTIGRVEDVANFTRFENNTPLKMDLEFVGTDITLDGSATVARSLKFEFPHVLYKSVPSETTEGIKTIVVTAGIYSASAAPSGMAFTDALRVTAVNDHGGNMLQIGNI